MNKIGTILSLIVLCSAVTTFAYENERHTTSRSSGLMRDHETTAAHCGVGNYLFRGDVGCRTNPSNISETRTTETTTTSMSSAMTETPETHIADPSTTSASAPDLKKSLYFGMNKSHLTKEHQAMISDAIEFWKKNPDTHFEIQGFADATGRLEYNRTLAKRRAEAVKRTLLEAGVASDKIDLVKPAEAVSSTEDRLADRKVELRLFRSAE